ncbi:MAG TPA: regulatory iron-sulfur-containing complex subunit RicT [Gemmatimonadaceae bacterium]|nr:regulatory iron-sulfur-containing complex subunit RicT [Gemmatimonadaceae bacterium]
MPHLIEVAFKGNRKEFYTWELDEAPPLKAAVIVDADRGEDLGHVHSVGELAVKRCAGCSHGCGSAPPARKAVRLAVPAELRQARDVRAQDDGARRKAAERVRAHGLGMKLTDAEWQWDRKKLTFYFTADKRVDFRNLVRDLAALFRARIELKQIGVRDEAKRLDGIGRCGRQYCSASWLPELRPVNLGVAKDQRLSLNPTQISGACGRLMCCLRYEHEFYVQSRKRFPKEGKIVVTSLGEEKVVSNDIFHERVTLRGPEGEARVVELAALKREIATAAGGMPVIEEIDEPNGVDTEDLSGTPADTAPDEDVSAAARRAQQPRPKERPARRQPTAPRTAPPAPPAQQPPAPPAAAPEASAATPAPGRRRRGRRGGRRGRGGGNQGNDGNPGSSQGGSEP